MQYKYAEIADTVYFWLAANDTTGTAADGTSPLYDVRLAGAAAGAAPVASGTPTLLTHADYSNGLFEIAINTTGFAQGEYAVFCTLTVSTVNPAGFCGSFKLRTAGAAALNCDVVTKTGFSLATAPLDAAGVRTAVGLASANLDAQLAAIVEDTGTTLPGSITHVHDDLASAVGGGLGKPELRGGNL